MSSSRTADAESTVPARPRDTRRQRPGRAWVAGLVVLVGAALTAAAVVSSWTVDRRNEHRLLTIQTRQAGALIGSAVVNIVAPLRAAAQAADVTNGDPSGFSKILSPAVGGRSTFASASLWTVDNGTPHRITTIGLPPVLAPTSSGALQLVRKAVGRSGFVVANAADASGQRIAYAIAGAPTGHFVVYAERAIPSNRQVAIEQDSGFADLRFATYVGTTLDSRSLATTNLPENQLPISGRTVRETVPFGDSVITVVAGARGHLGGALARYLPWMLLGAGLLLTALTVAFADRLVRRSWAAETAATELAALNEEVNRLYERERTTAETLQHALLPRTLPRVGPVETASRYVAGAAGVDIGGDWYSLWPVDDEHFAFVVGDVSGRGLSAARVMARLRYVLLAYLSEGHSPAKALQMCTQHIDIESDDHFATAIVGTASSRIRELQLASAGHLPPLLINDDGSCVFLETPTQLPLGIAGEAYHQTTFTLPPGATLICFTDGLVERRGESIDDGLQRLAVAARQPGHSLEGLLDGLLASVTEGGFEDDTAILALRWTLIPAARSIEPVLSEEGDPSVA